MFSATSVAQPLVYHLHGQAQWPSSLVLTEEPVRPREIDNTIPEGLELIIQRSVVLAGSRAGKPYSTTVTGNRAASDGGGIYNYGTLTLNNSRLTANVSGGGGGGLFSEGQATLNYSTVTGNTAAFGGGILSVNTLTLNHTTVSGNIPDDCSC